MYRAALASAVFILAACGDDSSSADPLPHEACETVEGLAPCCDPPAVEDLVCDEGAEVVREERGDTISDDCLKDGVLAGDRIGRRASGVVDEYRHGAVVVVCNRETGRMSTLFDLSGNCSKGCWDATGMSSTCPHTSCPPE